MHIDRKYIESLIQERDRISKELASYGIDSDGNCSSNLQDRETPNSHCFDGRLINDMEMNFTTRTAGWLGRNDDMLSRLN